MDQFVLWSFWLKRESLQVGFPSLVVPIDNLPFVFFRIVVGGQWALLTPQPGRLLNVIQPWPLSAAASFLFGYICIWDASASAISKGRQWRWQWQWAMQGRRRYWWGQHTGDTTNNAMQSPSALTGLRTHLLWLEFLSFSVHSKFAKSTSHEKLQYAIFPFAVLSWDLFGWRWTGESAGN